MSTITFENGKVVEFDGIPTQQDIDEVATTFNNVPEQPSVVKSNQQAPLSRFAGTITKPVEKISNFMFSSVGKTAGTLVGGLGENIEQLTRPKQLQQQIDPALAQQLQQRGPRFVQSLQEQGKGNIIQPLTTQPERRFKQTFTPGEIAFTALELSGVGAGKKALGYIPGGKLIIKTGEQLGEQLFKRGPEFMSRVLEKINLRLTPPQKQKIEFGVKNVIDWLAEKKIIGTPTSRYDKVDNLYEATEETFQSFLKIEAKDRTSSADNLIQRLQDLKSTYQNERDVLAIEKQINGFIDTVNTKYPKDIPVERLNELKRSTYKNAYNQAGDKVIDFVEHDIGDILRQEIELSVKDLKIGGKLIGEFNKEYGNVIQARKLLRIAKSRPQVGLVGKLLAISMAGPLGTAIGGPAGGAIAAAGSLKFAETLAGTLARSLVGAGLQNLSKLPHQQILETLKRLIIASSRPSGEQEIEQPIKNNEPE